MIDLGKVQVHGYNLIIRLLDRNSYIENFSLGTDINRDDMISKAKVREIELSNGQAGVAVDNNPYLAFGKVIKVGDAVKSVVEGDYVYISYSVMNPENMFFLEPLDMVETGMTSYLVIPEHIIKVSIKSENL